MNTSDMLRQRASAYGGDALLTQAAEELDRLRRDLLFTESLALKQQESAREDKAQAQKPVDMILYCPSCHRQHIDKAEPSMMAGDAAMYGGDWPGRWTNPPHRSHLCHFCGYQWRPSDVATNGVESIKTAGKQDSPKNVAADYAIRGYGAPIWLPIATAPKDNKRPLYLARFDEAGKLVEIDFDGVWEFWRESHELPDVCGYAWHSANGIEEPTHWAFQDVAAPATGSTIREAFKGLVVLPTSAQCGRFADDSPFTRMECGEKMKAGNPCKTCPTANPLRFLTPDHPVVRYLADALREQQDDDQTTTNL